MWVTRYRRFAGTRCDLTPDTARLHYLAGLREDPGVAEWQYRQADTATHIYLANWIPSITGERPGQLPRPDPVQARSKPIATLRDA